MPGLDTGIIVILRGYSIRCLESYTSVAERSQALKKTCEEGLRQPCAGGHAIANKLHLIYGNGESGFGNIFVVTTILRLRSWYSD